MAQVKINEKGELINLQTGESLGSINNGINFNSDSSELKSLQEMGVGLPETDLEKQEKENENENLSKSIELNYNEIKGNSSFKYNKSKYQVKKDSFFIVKFGLLMQQDGRFIPISYQSTIEFPKSEKHWVKFRMWNYMEELSWKQSVMEYNSKTKTQILNSDKLNQIKIKRLMLDWSFGEYDNELKLLHCDNLLSDESYEMFKYMYPSIAKTIIDLMNMVLENNQ